MKYQIAVCGSAEAIDAEVTRKSEVIGREIAKAGHIVLTGATTGYPYTAAQAAHADGAMSIVFSPEENREKHSARYGSDDAFDVLFPTGFGLEGRNTLMVRSADIVIFIGGRIGTVNEFTTAYQSFKLIGILSGSGGTVDMLCELAEKSQKKGGTIICDDDPAILVTKLLKAL